METTSYIGTSSKTRNLVELAAKVARGGDYPVLISGPIGSGKSHLARFVHSRSLRAGRSPEFIDCGSLPELENALFGHRRGAFTSAEQDLGGRLRRANGSTVVLDDFERLSLRQQDQLHRVVEDGVFYPLGEDRPHKVDTRFIATTNKLVPEEVDAGRLRADFVSRLSYFELRVAPLSERPEDVPILCREMLKRHLDKLVRKGFRKPVEVHFDEACWQQIASLRFEDNARGLEKLVVRLLAWIGDREVITPADVEAVQPQRRTPWYQQERTLRMVREAAEREYILAVCRHSGFNIREVARVLGVSRKCVYDKLKQYGIERPH